MKITAIEDQVPGTPAAVHASAFTDLAVGRLGITGYPGATRQSWMGVDILRALGHDNALAGAGRSADSDPLAVAAWLNARRITDLYCTFAWQLPPIALEGLLEIVKHTDIHLWLAGEGIMTDVARYRLEPHGWSTATPEDFLERWQPHLTSAHPAPARCADEDRDAWGDPLPTDSFPTFRAACRDLLPAPAFAVVDTYLHTQFKHATDTLVPLLEDFSARTGTPLERERPIAGWFHEQWDDTGAMNQFIVTARAAQVACFHAGWLLNFDLEQLIGTTRTLPSRALRDPDMWRRIGTYPQPHRAAVCALAAAGATTQEITDANVNDYNHAAGVLTTSAGRTLTVEPIARTLVDAQVNHRLLAGATGTDALLVTPGTARRLGTRTVAELVRHARREHHAALPVPDRRSPAADRWYRRWGLTLQELT